MDIVAMPKAFLVTRNNEREEHMLTTAAESLVGTSIHEINSTSSLAQSHLIMDIPTIRVHSPQMHNDVLRKSDNYLRIDENSMKNKETVSRPFSAPFSMDNIMKSHQDQHSQRNTQDIMSPRLESPEIARRQRRESMDSTRLDLSPVQMVHSGRRNSLESLYGASSPSSETGKIAYYFVFY